MPLDIDNMSVLDRRRIEAMVLGPMIRAFEEEVGRERAHAVARRVIVKIAEEQGRALSERMGGDDLPAFSRSKDPWVRGGALETDTLEDNDSRVSFNVTRCRYAEMYREIGMSDLGGIFSCGRDGALFHRLQLPHQTGPQSDHHGGRNPLRLPLHHRRGRLCFVQRRIDHADSPPSRHPCPPFVTPAPPSSLLRRQELRRGVDGKGNPTLRHPCPPSSLLPPLRRSCEGRSYGGAWMGWQSHPPSPLPPFRRSCPPFRHSCGSRSLWRGVDGKGNPTLSSLLPPFRHSCPPFVAPAKAGAHGGAWTGRAIPPSVIPATAGIQNLHPKENRTCRPAPLRHSCGSRSLWRGVGREGQSHHPSFRQKACPRATTRGPESRTFTQRRIEHANPYDSRLGSAGSRHGFRRKLRRAHERTRRTQADPGQLHLAGQQPG